jgi:hypothetical protein
LSGTVRHITIEPETEDEMQSLTPFLAVDHIREILREADTDRQARLLSSAGPRRRSAWRRRIGVGARGLSAALADLAVRLDPALCRPSYGRE